jgi:GrpB-like predicted nucleotidyltransferase (UPF0157 family)
MVEIVAYNALWPNQFAEAKEGIIKELANNFRAIHHVGSTAIPGLCAKAKIDIILVVKSRTDARVPLEKLGYEYRGEYNIPLRHFFRQRQQFNVNLHLYEEGNPDIELNILFRDYLLNSAAAREEYFELKQSLIKKQKSHEKNARRLTGYNMGKDAFIRKILRKTGYNGFSFRFCSHHFEWESYHCIAKERIFTPLGKIYDLKHSNFTNPEYRHFVLYQGVDIVAIAEIHLTNSANVKYSAVDTNHNEIDYQLYLKKLLEQWVSSL